MLFMANAFGWVFHLSIKSFQIDFFFVCLSFSFFHFDSPFITKLYAITLHSFSWPMYRKQIYWRCTFIDLAAEKKKTFICFESWLIRIAHLKFGHDWRFCHKMHLRSNGFECFENRCGKRNMNFQFPEWIDKRQCTGCYHLFYTCSLLWNGWDFELCCRNPR